MKSKKIFILIILVSIIVLSLLKSSVLAAGNCAFSAGMGEKGYMIPHVKKAASTYASMGYNSYYATESATFDVLRGSFANGVKRLESDIVFLTGHGSSYSLSVTDSSGVAVGFSTDKYVGTEDVNWRNVKMAIFLACNTGNGENNLAHKVFEKSGWTTITMGWKQYIEQGSAADWINNFNSKLSTGATVDESLSYANGKQYDDWRVKDISFFGTGSTILKKQSTMLASSNNIDETNCIRVLEKQFYYDGTESTNQNLYDAIKSINNLFEGEKYEIFSYKIKEDGSYYTVDLIYKDEEYYTNSCYTLIVEDQFVTQIYDNTYKNIKTAQTVNSKESQSKVNIAKDLARNELLQEENLDCMLNIKNNTKKIEIREQEARLYKDLETNKIYVQVFTTFGYEGNVDTNCKQYMYEIK